MLTKENLPDYTKALRDAVGFYPAIRKVLYRFDGKVYNKRFDDAVAETTSRKCFVARDSYNRDYVEIYAHGFNFGSQSLLRFKLSDLPDGKRIDAFALSKLMNDQRDSLLKKAYSLESAIDDAGNVLNELQSLISLITQLVDPLPYEFIDAYRLQTLASLKYFRA